MKKSFLAKLSAAFNGKKENPHPPTPEDVHKDLVSQVLSLIINDEKLSSPIYINDFSKESDSQYLNEYPIVYSWTPVDSDNVMCSVNGNGVAKIVEHFINRSDSGFIPVRNEVIAVLSTLAPKILANMSDSLGAFPHEILPNVSIEDISGATLTYRE